MCDCCLAARETTGLWRYYELQCVWCGARLIQRIGALPVIPSVIKQRRQAVLKDWTAFGHSEQEIRELVAGPMAVEPIAKPEKGKK